MNQEKINGAMCSAADRIFLSCTRLLCENNGSGEHKK